MKISILLAFFILITSCATSNKMTPEKQANIDAIKKDYITCLGKNAADYIDGSNDVYLLVNHVLSLCESNLKGSKEKLNKMGFSSPYSQGFIKGLRVNGKNKITSAILLRKQQDNQENN